MRAVAEEFVRKEADLRGTGRRATATAARRPRRPAGHGERVRAAADNKGETSGDRPPTASEATCTVCSARVRSPLAARNGPPAPENPEDATTIPLPDPRGARR